MGSQGEKLLGGGKLLGNSPSFQMQLEDLRLKYCIPEENS
jgi:hypothetical protein